MAPPFATVFLPAAVLVGLIVGSFLNVVAHRLPRMLELTSDADAARPSGPYNLARPGSHCPRCAHAIAPWDNVPVLSWILLHGRCRHCGASIPIRYPLVEIAAALGAGLLAVAVDNPLRAVAAMLLYWILLALTVIDLDHRVLPDEITLPGLWLGLLINIPGVLTSLRSAVLGAAVGYLSLWSLYHLFRLVTGKEGMGYGDFKLYALLGAWLGLARLPLVILVASALGSIVGLGLIATRRLRSDTPIPFGPFLAAGGLVSLLAGHAITSGWLHLAFPHG
ncbi:MAG: A24 family peptidase [Gammaproteobacteria bacterium]|jgi:leader peptidase (prepilin peptidase)/N-methyltransferase|nr:A24 family peptidase [Gammaproteobacteria bacterium]